MLASDPLFDAGMVVMGHHRETAFWEQTLVNVASRFGVTSTAKTHVECVDPTYQRRHARNIWQNAAIRTGLYLGTAPVVRVTGRLPGLLGGPARASAGRE